MPIPTFESFCKGRDKVPIQARVGNKRVIVNDGVSGRSLWKLDRLDNSATSAQLPALAAVNPLSSCQTARNVALETRDCDTPISDGRNVIPFEVRSHEPHRGRRGFYGPKAVS
jgi:hypothetical protein